MRNLLYKIILSPISSNIQMAPPPNKLPYYKVHIPNEATHQKCEENSFKRQNQASMLNKGIPQWRSAAALWNKYSCLHKLYAKITRMIICSSLNFSTNSTHANLEGLGVKCMIWLELLNFMIIL